MSLYGSGGLNDRWRWRDKDSSEGRELARRRALDNEAIEALRARREAAGLAPGRRHPVSTHVTAHAQVREERLRSTAGLRGSPALVLSAWRGLSGKRYVVEVHGPDDIECAEAGVYLAVCRDELGTAVILLRKAVRFGDLDFPAWLQTARARGATEIHLHRLAETPEERDAVVADLIEDAPAPAVS